jgi:hypothetical protein
MVVANITDKRPLTEIKTSWFSPRKRNVSFFLIREYANFFVGRFLLMYQHDRRCFKEQQQQTLSVIDKS